MTFYSYSFSNDKVSLQLQWKYQFQFAGYIIAKEKGFYDDVSLDVNIKEWDHGIDIIKDLLDDKSTFTISRTTACINDLNQNNLVFLAAIFQSSPLILLADERSGIKSVTEFKNKKLMATEDINTNISLMSMIFSNDVKFSDMELLKHSFDVKDLLNGKTDLMGSYISNEPYLLKELGGKPIIFSPKDYGFNFYDDILITSNKYLKQNPKIVKNFTEASLKGWEYAFNHIEETAELLFNKYNTQKKSKQALLYEGEALKKLALNGVDELGSIKREKLERIYDIYNLLGLPNKNIDYDKLIYNQNHYKSTFSKKEKEYIKNSKTIKVCTNPNWTPIEFTNVDGEPNGISIDILKLVGEKSGLQFQFIKTTSWGESQEFLKNKKCDILPAAIKTSKREKYANFTKPYLTYSLAIITQDNKPLVERLDSIINQKMARKEKSGLITQLKEKYPNINIMETKNYKDAFKAVSKGDAYFTIATLPVLSYYKNLYNFDNLQIAGYTDIEYPLSIVVRDDEPVLVDVLDKTLLNISNEAKNIIYEKWLSKSIETKFDYDFLINILIVLSIIFFFFIYKQYMLNKSLKEFDELINATIEGIAIFNDGKCIDVNQSLVNILGYETKSEIIGKDVLSFVPNMYLEDAKVKLNQETLIPYEFEVLKKDNTKIPVLLKGHYIRNKKFKLISIVDITLLKHQEEQILQQAKLVSMGEMIGNIAHQWRQPLSVISTSATGIKVQKEYGVLDDKFLFEACDAIDNNVQYLSKTIDDFRNFIKGDRTKASFSADEIIKSLLNLIEPSAKTHDITIITNIDSSITLNGYKNELNQCFMNIYNNAKDVLLDKHLKHKLLFIDIIKTQNHIEIIFKDNGGGISKNILPKIFEPYFTTKHKSQGTGLGLNMTYNLITKGMDGEIAVENEKFEYKKETYVGAKFIIKLPIEKF